MTPKLGDQPAFLTIYETGGPRPQLRSFGGLSKREHYIGLAIQGILSACPRGLEAHMIEDHCLEAWAVMSRRIADALLAELSKEQKP